jgi:hypothetical protein
VHVADGEHARLARLEKERELLAVGREILALHVAPGSVQNPLRGRTWVVIMAR